MNRSFKLLVIFLAGLLVFAGCTQVPSVQETVAPPVPPTQSPVATAAEPPTEAPALPTPTQTAEDTALPPQVHQPASALRLASIVMLDEQNGWGWSEGAIYRTADGGATWEDVTPPGLDSSQGWLSVFCLDANTGWVIVPDAQDTTTGRLFRTTDGGAAWQSFQTPFGGGQLQFLDAQNGWALFVSGAAAGSAPADIYRTQDGGQTWVKVYGIDPAQEDPVGLPFSGMKNGLSFTDGARGWVTGSVPMEGYAWLYLTQDGGETWQRQELTLPKDYANAMLSIDPPRFFGPQAGLLPVLLSANTPAWDFYATRDGGATWTATTPASGGGSYDFISPQEGWVWDGKTLQSTKDGGQTWTALQTNVDLREMLARLDFVSSTTGWALAMDAGGQTCLYKTTDGGQTWFSPCS